MTITMTCRAFSGEGPRTNKLHIDDHGTVRVYDSVAGYYTTCHSLSSSAVRRARQIGGAQ